MRSPTVSSYIYSTRMYVLGAEIQYKISLLFPHCVEFIHLPIFIYIPAGDGKIANSFLQYTYYLDLVFKIKSKITLYYQCSVFCINAFLSTSILK
jgi:hypothetical protein